MKNFIIGLLLGLLIEIRESVKGLKLLLKKEN